MGIYAIKPKFQRVLRPIAAYLIKHKVHPTVINVVGLACALMTALAIYDSLAYRWLLLIVPVTTTVRTACNALDGLVARGLGVSSNFGEVLNEFIDRVSDSVILFSLLFIDEVQPLAVTALIILVLWSSYLGILSKAAGASRQYGGLVGKADRMIYIAITALAVYVTGNNNWWNWLVRLLIAGMAVTIVQRLLLIKRDLAGSGPRRAAVTPSHKAGPAAHHSHAKKSRS